MEGVAVFSQLGAMSEKATPTVGGRGASLHRWTTVGLRLAACLGAVLVMGASTLEAQIDGWWIGRTWSGMDTDYSDGMNSSSAQDRRLVGLGVSTRLRDWSPVELESGLRLVPKGFEVTGPTFHMEYLEVPLIVSLESGPGPGGFLQAGFLGGLRVHCRKRIGREWEGCGGENPLAWWDLSWEVGAGLQLGKKNGGAVRLFARFARSLLDVKREAPGQSHNRVVTVGMAFAFDDPGRR